MYLGYFILQKIAIFIDYMVFLIDYLDITFMEVDGKIVFFNESESVVAKESGEDHEHIPHRKLKKK